MKKPTRIVIDLPEWAEERHIYILAGMEMLAYKLYGEDVINIKEGRCNFCGECCKDLKPFPGLTLDSHGTCVNLKQVGSEWVCALGLSRPTACSISLDQKGRVPSIDCAIEYKPKPLDD